MKNAFERMKTLEVCVNYIDILNNIYKLRKYINGKAPVHFCNICQTNLKNGSDFLLQGQWKGYWYHTIIVIITRETIAKSLWSYNIR